MVRKDHRHSWTGKERSDKLAEKPRGSAITRSDAFAIVVSKLGFNPLS
jgi:hypothetical protein